MNERDRWLEAIMEREGAGLKDVFDAINSRIEELRKEQMRVKAAHDELRNFREALIKKFNEKNTGKQG